MNGLVNFLRCFCDGLITKMFFSSGSGGVFIESPDEERDSQKLSLWGPICRLEFFNLCFLVEFNFTYRIKSIHSSNNSSSSSRLTYKKDLTRYS